MKISIRRTLGLGDAIACTVVADGLTRLGHQIVFATHPALSPVIRLNPTIHQVIPALPNTPSLVNLDGCYEDDPRKKEVHFQTLILEAANKSLERYGARIPSQITRPTLIPALNKVTATRSSFPGHTRPWVFICPRSESYNVRQVPDRIWEAFAQQVEGTCFWLGLHPAPKGIVDPRCRNLSRLVELIANADVLVTVDTGPMHIADALGVPIVAVKQAVDPALRLSGVTPYSIVAADLDCLNCQLHLCPKCADRPPCQGVDPDALAQAVRFSSCATHAKGLGMSVNELQ